MTQSTSSGGKTGKTPLSGAVTVKKTRKRTVVKGQSSKMKKRRLPPSTSISLRPQRPPPPTANVQGTNPKPSIWEQLHTTLETKTVQSSHRLPASPPLPRLLVNQARSHLMIWSIYYLTLGSQQVHLQIHLVNLLILIHTLLSLPSSLLHKRLLQQLVMEILETGQPSANRHLPPPCLQQSCLGERNIVQSYLLAPQLRPPMLLPMPQTSLTSWEPHMPL